MSLDLGFLLFKIIHWQILLKIIFEDPFFDHKNDFDFPSCALAMIAKLTC